MRKMFRQRRRSGVRASQQSRSKSAVRSIELLEQRLLLAGSDWIAFGERQIVGDTIRLGGPGQTDDGAQRSAFHGVTAPLPPSGEHAIDFDDIDLSYNVCWRDFSNTHIDMNWAGGPAESVRAGSAIDRFELNTDSRQSIGSYQQAIRSDTVESLAAALQTATHLLMTIDSDDVVVGTDEQNNVSGSPILDFEIADSSRGVADGIQGGYSLVGNLYKGPDPFGLLLISSNEEPLLAESESDAEALNASLPSVAYQIDLVAVDPIEAEDLGSSVDDGMITIFDPDDQLTNLAPLGESFETLLPEISTYAVQVITDSNDPETFVYEVSGTTMPPDVPGILLSQTEILVSESGTTASIEVVLAAQPTESVVLQLSNDLTGRIAAHPRTMLFTSENWNVPQTVTVRALPNLLDDGNQVVRLSVSPLADLSDPLFAHLAGKEIEVAVIDQDINEFELSVVANRLLLSARSSGQVISDTPASAAMPLLIQAGGRKDTFVIAAEVSSVYPVWLNAGDGDDTVWISDLGMARLDGGNGFDSLRLNGTGLTIDLTTLPSNSIVGFEQIDLTGMGDNRLIVSIDSVLNHTVSTGVLRVIHDAGDSISFGTGWRAQVPTFIDGVLTHVMSPTVNGENVRIEVQNDRFFLNPLNRFDVNRNGTVHPIDAFFVINAMRRLGVGPLELPGYEHEINGLYFDVSGNNVLSGLDALLVINAISRINRGSIATGEAGSPFAVSGLLDLTTTNRRDVIDIRAAEPEASNIDIRLDSVQQKRRHFVNVDDYMQSLSADREFEGTGHDGRLAINEDFALGELDPFTVAHASVK
jgi:hypothetical protein